MINNPYWQAVQPLVRPDEWRRGSFEIVDNLGTFARRIDACKQYAWAVPDQKVCRLCYDLFIENKKLLANRF